MGPYAGYIIGCYAIVGVVVAALIVWVIAEHRAMRRQLGELERAGVARRSAARTNSP
jgi:heme exporter protein CcmD